jgi:hypothetical protein
MFSALLVAGLLLQEHSRAFDSLTLMVRSEVRAFEADRKRVEKLQRMDFELNFQKLVHALNAFSMEYNRSKGAVWPAKEAEALRKAMERLQSADKRLAGR